jgi:predicted AlkP superfamily pyrophosphatase or phosphodiesterase
MKNTLLIILCLCMAACLHSQQIRHVVVIGIDGCDIDGLTHAHTPHIDSLRAHGSWTYECKAQMPTVSSPNWASILDGVPPAVHGIWSNSWHRRDIRDSVYCGGRKGETVPTIFKVLHQSNKHAQICCITEWWSFRRLVDRRVCSLLQRTVWESVTDVRVPTVISVRRPEFLFIHFNNVDETGHSIGHGTQAYYKAIERVDESVGKIIAAVKKAGMWESTVFIVIADHGGIGHGHGGSTPQEVNVPFIVSGAGIRQNHHITTLVNNYDCPVTIAKMLNAKTPACWQGKVVSEIFE